MASLISSIFLECVELMRLMATLTGLSYKEINTIIFLILQPLLMLIFLPSLAKREGKKQSKRELISYVANNDVSWQESLKKLLRIVNKGTLYSHPEVILNVIAQLFALLNSMERPTVLNINLRLAKHNKLT